MFTEEFFADPAMAELIISCLTAFLSLFLRGIQFKNVQYDEVVSSGIVSMCIKLVDAIGICIIAVTPNVYVIAFTSIFAGLGTVTSLLTRRLKNAVKRE